MNPFRRVADLFNKTGTGRNTSALQNQFSSLIVEPLEPRMMLNGTVENLIFQADFEDVDVQPGGFAFFSEVSGLSATGGQVEVQDNHPSVGPASSGNQLLELDGVNGVQVDLGERDNDLRLVFDYSARPGVDAVQSSVEVFFNNRLIDIASADGTRLRSTRFQPVELSIEFADAAAGVLEFRSNSPNDQFGLGGLIDNIRVFELLGDIELDEIPDQEVSLEQSVDVTVSLLPPNDAVEGAIFELVDGPDGATIDAQTGLVNWVATPANVAATDARNDQTVVGDPELVFQSSFENVDVASGGFDFFAELSGFIATGRGVEVQDNHPSVGGASDGRQLVELDGRNGITRTVSTVAGDQYELVLDYSARPGVDAASNAIDVIWDGEVLETISADGSRLRTTDFNEFRFDLSQFTEDLTQLTLASRESGAVAGLGGLIDNVRLVRRPVTVIDGEDGKYNVTVRVTTPDGRSDTESFTICLTEDSTENRPPVLQPVGEQGAIEGAEFNLILAANDPDLPNDQLSYEVQSGPTGLGVDATTGQLTWTPTEQQGPGEYEVSVRVLDAVGNFDSATFLIVVDEANSPPVLAPIADQIRIAGDIVALTAAATDSDIPANVLTYTLSDDSPDGATIDPVSGAFAFETPSELEQTYPVTVVVTDSAGASDSVSFSIMTRIEADANNSGLSGFVFEDSDEDGVRDAGEFGIGGRLVYLDSNDNEQFDEGELSAVTQYDNPATDADEQGRYTFNQLSNGDYIVRILPLNSNQVTVPIENGAYSVSLGENESLTGFDFGSFFASGSISGTKFLDVDGDGLATSSPVVLSDGEFAESDWEFRVIRSPENSSGTGVRTLETEGGIDGAFHRITNTIPVGEFVFSESINRTAIYDLSEGAIDSIDFSIDTRAVSFGAAIQLVIEQDGKRFYNVPYEGFSGDWSTFTRNYTVSDFDSNPNIGVNSPGEIRTGERPDFSASGSPLTFGYLAGNTAFGVPGLSATAQFDLDNWQVLLNRAGATASEFEIYLDQNDNGQLDDNERSIFTDENGNYRFEGLPEGNYIVREVQGPGFRQVLPADQLTGGKHELTLMQGEDRTGVDFLNELINRPPTITSTPPVTTSSEDSATPAYQYDVDATDPDDDQLVFTVETGPEGILIDSSSGLVSWNPADGFGRTNLVTNSHFDDGLTGFVTDYGNDPTVAQSAVVTNNPNSVFDAWGNFGDNTTGDGGMLLVNGALEADQTVWETTVSVNRNTNYIFSTAYTSAFPISPAQLQFEINGQILTAVNLNSELGEWNTISRGWNSGNATSATLRIVDLNLVEFGNDFALDDIKFEQVFATVPVVVRATDPLGLFDEQRFEITLDQGTNFPPRVVSSPLLLAVPDSPYSYQIAVEDFDSTVFEYSLVSGPSEMNLSDEGLITWTPSLDDLGTESVVIQISDLQGNTTRQSYDLEVSTSDTIAPTVSVTSSTTIANLGDAVVFTAAASDNLAVESLELIVDGVAVALDGNGRATVVTSRSGIILAVATAVDEAGNSRQAFTRLRVLAPDDVSAPTVEIVSPQMNSEVTYLTDVVATVNDENLDFYSVEFARASDVDLINLAAFDKDYRLLANGTQDINNEIVATFDPSVLQNDSYVIRVLAQDVNGRIQARGTIVNVIGDAKLGNFRLDFTDLSIPLAGIPIQINRGYDTLNANDQLSGGFGWDIGLADPDIRETVPDSGGGFFSQNGYKVGTRVFITAPDGRRVGFTFQPDPVGSLIGTSWSPKFVADAGVNLTLEDAGPPVTLGQSGDGSFGVGFFGFSIGGYNPSDFILTTEDGTKYFYNQDAGLTSVEDTNGNTLTVTDEAITHSGGQSIQFVRDDQGRVTQIIDSDGNTIQYDYDTNGDLVRFTDQSGESTRFEYSDEIPHYLERVIDSNGVVTASVKYDENQRFVALVDALGNELEQEFDLEENTFAQVDANGNRTLVKFDDRGNVVEETDALGNTTLYEYTDSRNPTAETAITDRNGNTTRFKYDGRGNTVLIEDENGQFTRFQYDALNNVTQIIGPADADPGDGFADTLVDSFFRSGEVTGLTVREDLDDNNAARVFESAAPILGPSFDPDTEGPLDSDHIVLEAGDYVTVAFDEVVADRPGDDLFIYTSFFFGNFTQQGRRADVSVSTDGVTFVSVGQVGELNDNGVDLADAGITDEVQLVRITALETGVGDPNNYALTSIQASPADNPSTRFEYDENGNLIGIENQLGDTAAFTYDGLGRRLTFTDFNGNETAFDYTDTDGNPDVIRFADGAYQELEYNQFGQTTRESFFESDGTLVEQTQSVYDDAGKLMESIDGEGNRVVRTYEGNNLITETIVNPESVGESVDTPVSERLSRITQLEYDDAGRVVSQTDAEGGVVQFRFDGNGNRILLQDPVGNITTWIYDAEDRMVEERDPLFNEGLSVAAALAALETPSGADVAADRGADHVRVFDYDAEGNQIERIDRNGRRIESVYDQTDRLLEERWYSSTGALVDTAEFTYDDRGNQLTAIDGDSSLTFAYDELNRVVSLSNAGTAGAPTTVLEYEYDAQGNVVLTTDNSGVTVESLYDVRNRLASKLWFDADGSGDVDDARVDYQYNAAGRVAQILRWSDLLQTTLVGSTDRTYDLAGRSDVLAHLNGANELIASYDYDYDFGGLLINENRQHQLAQFSQSAVYGYDLTGQLLSAEFTGQPDEFFIYDANGNRETDSRPGSVYSTETGNRLTSDGLFDYEYDGEGNLVLKTKLTTDDDGEVGESTEYEYDHRNRLIAVTIKSSGGVILHEVSYAFDAFGLRTARTENGDTIHFVYDGDNVWADFDQSGEAVTRYLFGNKIDENITRFRAGEGTVWYLTDRLGTVRDLVDASGQAVNHTEYESFGKILSQLDEAVADRYSFTGREFDRLLNFSYFRARFLDFSIGRFASKDPIGFDANDPNLFGFVFNSPINGTDPTGLEIVGQAALTDGIAVANLGSTSTVGIQAAVNVSRIAATPTIQRVNQILLTRGTEAALASAEREAIRQFLRTVISNSQPLVNLSINQTINTLVSKIGGPNLVRVLLTGI